MPCMCEVHLHSMPQTAFALLGHVTKYAHDKAGLRNVPLHLLSN